MNNRELSPFEKFCVSSQALNTFLKEFLNNVDKIILKSVCKYFNKEFSRIEGKTKLIDVAVYHGYFLLANWIHINWTNQPAIKLGNRIASIAISEEDKSIQRWLIEENILKNQNNICFWALEKKNWDLFKWSIGTGGYNVTISLALKVMETRDYDLFHRTYHSGCVESQDICIKAAQLGELGMLTLPRFYKCPWPDNICCIAFAYGHIKLLKWARSNGAPINSSPEHKTICGCSLIK